MLVRNLLVATSALAVLGCGGRVADDGRDDPSSEPGGPTTPAPEKAPDPPPQGAPTGSAAPFGDPTDLPECEGGFAAGSARGRSCDWMANSLCFDDKLQACACICPRPTGTTCSSDFPRPGGAVAVRCF